MYKDFADREHDPIIKAIIEAKKSVVMNDMRLAYHDQGANDIATILQKPKSIAILAANRKVFFAQIRISK